MAACGAESAGEGFAPFVKLAAVKQEPKMRDRHTSENGYCSSGLSTGYQSRYNSPRVYGGFFLRARRLSDQQIAELYASGLDSFSCGLEAGCDAQTVLKIVRAQGGTVRQRGGHKPRARSSISIEEAARLYDSGLSVEDVALVAGLDHATMRHRLIRFGVRMRTLKDVATMKRLQGLKWGRPKKG